MTPRERVDAALAARDKATPGPWSIYHHREGKRQFLQVDIGDKPSGRRPCIIFDSGFESCDLPKKERLMNARLIAAAPDLCDEVVALRTALEKMMYWAEHYRSNQSNITLKVHQEIASRIAADIAEAERVMRGEGGVTLDTNGNV